MLDVHQSKKAWDLGYTGEGVKVMVNDTGTDFAHPDLIGTIARITDPESPYLRLAGNVRLVLDVEPGL